MAYFRLVLALAAALAAGPGRAEPPMSDQEAAVLGALLCKAPEINRQLVDLCGAAQPALARRAELALQAWTRRNDAAARKLAPGCEPDSASGAPGEADQARARMAAGMRTVREHFAATIKDKPGECARFLDDLASPTGPMELRE